MLETENGSSARQGNERFTTTHWSVVLAAKGGNSTCARAALEALCRAYWYPLYAFARRLGLNPADAEDMVQGFFERCLEKDYLASADQAKGRFRSFLLIALKRFMANQADKSRARKRGSGQALVALDALSAENRYAREPGHELSPDKLFERRWALTLLDRVLDQLRAEQAATGRSEMFEALKDCLTGRAPEAAYAALGARFGLNAGALRIAAHRLRRRYRELLEAEIARTVSSPREIEEERRYLFSILSR